MTRVADLRLAPAALAAWLGAAVLVGIPGAAGATAAAASAGAALALGVAILRGARAARGGRPAERSRSDRRPAAGRRATGLLPAVALALAALAVAAGAIAAGEGARRPPVLAEAAEAARSVDLDATVAGRVVEGRVRVVVDVARVGDAVVAMRVPALVFARGDPVVAAAPIGASLRLTATLRPAEEGDAVAYLVFAREDATLLRGPPALLAGVDAVRDGFRAEAVAVGGPAGRLLPGLAIGDTSALDEALARDMKVGSLTHLTAVSGANCAVVVALVFLGLGLVGAPRALRVGAALAALVVFAVLVTPEPSVLRASVMAAAALVGLALGRPARGLPLLCLSVVALVVVDPWLAREYGFTLSVLATAGLLVLAGPIAAWLGRAMPRPLALAIAVPTAAQLACQPVILLLAPALPLYGVPANALAGPAAPVATMLGLAGCLLLPVVPGLGQALVWLASLPSAWIAAVATFFASLPGARSPWPDGPPGVALLVVVTAAALGAVLIAVPRRVRAASRAIVAIAVVGYVAAVAGIQVVTATTRPADWQYALCDVGQGDATLVRSAGAVALVDTGPDPQPLRDCLDELGIGRLDLLVLTHYDLDHVGGTDAVLGRVDRVLLGPVSDPEDARLAQRLAATGARVEHVTRGLTGALGELDWEVLWPPPRGVEPGNPASVTLLLRGAPGCGDRCLSGILLGDLGEQEQARLLGAAHPAPVDVVKVAHHGSADQSTRLYSALRARVGLIGVGAGNDYGHPREETLAVLAGAGTAAYRTDRDGMVLVAPGESGAIRVWTQHARADGGARGPLAVADPGGNSRPPGIRHRRRSGRRGRRPVACVPRATAQSERVASAPLPRRARDLGGVRRRPRGAARPARNGDGLSSARDPLA